VGAGWWKPRLEILCAICDGLACDIAAITVGIPEKHGLIS
jgi:hypothetical protein